MWTCIRKGPFSLNIPYMEGQPGPPCSQRTNGPIITLVWGMTDNIKPFVRNKKLLDSSLINLFLDSFPSGRARRKVESLSQDQLSRNHWSSQHPPAHQPLWVRKTFVRDTWDLAPMYQENDWALVRYPTRRGKISPLDLLAATARSSGVSSRKSVNTLIILYRVEKQTVWAIC